MRPETRYARSGDVNIAYQVVGAGEVDLVLVHGWVFTFDPGWEDPEMARFYRRLASFSRLILFDKRGTGLSDRVSVDDLPDLETRMDDVRAVLDAVGSRQTALVGISEGGPMCALFAATYPERVRSLVLIGSFARRTRTDGYPEGLDPARDYERGQIIEEGWPRGYAQYFLELHAPSIAADGAAVDRYARLFVRGASPGAAVALFRMNSQIDIRAVLPSIRVPTLVLYRRGETYNRAGEFLASRIPGAKAAALPGDDHVPWVGDQEAVLDEIEEFLTGARPQPVLDRVLATVLFTDIVGSTARAADLGDRRWSEVLAEHHAIVRVELERYRGRELDTAGDGFLATFDGPGRAVACAAAIVAAVRPLGLELRAGLHTGEIELDSASARGIAVHTGARVAAAAAPGEVLVTSTVKDLVAGSGLEFDDRGMHELRGIPGEWRLYAVRR
ncbi:MAG: adenylate/guanylate cyclase domain-containing protein [Actinomycetota bacterium]|nr:adenylate/guanylate cyclase domain-containing protein [Actinomycetota bacterium]